MLKPIYIKNFIIDPDNAYKEFFELNWLEATEARKEYFMSDPAGLVYTYGKGFAARTYTREQLDKTYNTNYDLCFFNRYDEPKNALGWHADDSPEMNPDHPIAVVSIGAEREIWWKEKDFKGVLPAENKQILHHGSLFIMPKGFQQLYFHRIPKCNHECGTRISLTFRNYKK